MKNLPDERQIYISGRLWHEIYPKMDIAPFIFALHEGIDLTKYDEGLKKLYFTFLVMPPDDKVLAPYQHYSAKKQEADISVRISYEQVVHATESEIVKLMEQAYLQGIEQLKGLCRIGTGFDVEGLKRDVEKIFEKEGWYEVVEAAV
ncbi:MAG: hypothetical protein IPO07_26885 [Haliscomenobacter sp.]|nr:hypothetical protein [Haliscomenobacter sp.]MBK9492023.1 hypothetical protein [Haliscomenobacter sp.]